MAQRLRTWRQLLTLALSVTLLPAVPVSALTFLRPWKVAQTKRINDAPVAEIVPDFAGTGSLLVGMGRTTSPGAKSRVVASRDFEIGPDAEMVSISRVFETPLNDASLSVKMKITPKQPTKFGTLKFNSMKWHERVFDVNDTKVLDLAPGDYRLQITIGYTNRTGEWDNTFPRPGSPHTFAIRSL